MTSPARPPALSSGGLVGEPARWVATEPRAPTIKQPGAGVGHQRAIEFAELRSGRCFGKANDLVVRLVDLQDDADVSVGGVDGGNEIVNAGAVGRSDLEICPGTSHHLRNPESTADLHQLTAAHDNVFPVGEPAEHKKDGRCAIVHHDGVLSSARLGNQRPSPSAILADHSRGRVRVGVPLRLRPGHRRTTEVRVQNGSGCIVDGSRHAAPGHNGDLTSSVWRSSRDRRPGGVHQHRVGEAGVGVERAAVDRRWALGGSAIARQLTAANDGAVSSASTLAFVFEP